jgi:quercetin dioxygenase-like cupin family protein
MRRERREDDIAANQQPHPSSLHLENQSMTSTSHSIDSATLEWIPLRDGLSFRPLQFAEDGYSLQLRLEPGVTIARHRHTGEVHAYNLFGTRELIETGKIVGPGTYVFEPAGNVDSWRCIGDEPCVVQISLKGRVEYLNADGVVIDVDDAFSTRDAYQKWCDVRGVIPNVALIPDHVSTSASQGTRRAGRQ